jgi:undecaprenyl diphosphate synthase
MNIIMEENNIPTHVAIIMDGNRRWARKRNIDYRLGHKEGAKTLEKIVRYAKKVGIKYITVYAFSTENWKRTSEEVSALMLLLKTYLDDYGKRADTENIKVKVLGDISALAPGLQKSIKKCEERTKDNDGIYFSICINYGGRDEIVHAVKKIAQDVKDGKIGIDDINEKLMNNYLYTKEIPDPDLIIRTSGELRTSGFLTWQSVYSEYLFMDKYWPDFSEDDIDFAIKEYQKRNRKFGAK